MQTGQRWCIFSNANRTVLHEACAGPNSIMIAGLLPHACSLVRVIFLSLKVTFDFFKKDATLDRLRHAIALTLISVSYHAENHNGPINL